MNQQLTDAQIVEKLITGKSLDEISSNLGFLFLHGVPSNREHQFAALAFNEVAKRFNSSVQIDFARNHGLNGHLMVLGIDALLNLDYSTFYITNNVITGQINDMHIDFKAAADAKYMSDERRGKLIGYNAFAIIASKELKAITKYIDNNKHSKILVQATINDFYKKIETIRTYKQN